MQRPPALPDPAPLPDEMTEILRQSLSGLLPGDPLAYFLDRLEKSK